MWLAPDATATWEAVGVGTRGGQLQYSDLAIETALPLNEKGTLSKNAIAEGIINNVRKIIIREQLTDPRFYEQMSKLLDDLIKQNRADATAYEEFLRMVEPLVKRLAGKQSDEGVPASLYGKREATVIYNNLPRILAAGRARADRAAEESPEYGDERVRLALEIDQVMREWGIVNLASCWQSYRMPSYRGYRFPPDIISHAVWLYHRFALSFRDVEDLLARRGVDVTYEAIRKWCRRFGPEYAGRLRRRRGRLGDTWHLDEVFVTIQGRQQYLWRAVDEDGDVLDILVQPRRNRHAAVRFFRRLLKTQRHVPRPLITDTLRSYSAACRTVMPSVLHCTDQYANNRAEVSHQPTRQRERQMRRFTSAAQLQRFASVHGIVQNLFRVGRHLLRSAHHRLLRTRAFVEWDAVTCAC